MTNTSSRVCLLAVLMFLNVCSAFFLKCEWKWLIFICSNISGCILIIEWTRSSNSSNFYLLPSKVIILELTGRIVSCWAVGRFCILVKTSSSLLIGSDSVRFALVMGSSCQVGDGDLHGIGWDDFLMALVPWETQELGLEIRFLLSLCRKHSTHPMGHCVEDLEFAHFSDHS